LINRAIAYDAAMSDAAPASSRLLEGTAVLANPLVQELLGLRLVAVLGTVGRDGVPHLTPVWLADDGDSLLIATASTSRKLQNLEDDPRASLVLHDSRPGCEVCGVSATGRVTVVAGPEAAPLVERVHARYVSPDASRLPEVAGFLASDDVALRFVPERAWTWDQRATPASRALRASGGALPLEPTTPR
jgi:PPOX class probable F420-dependent enzyme